MRPISTRTFARASLILAGLMFVVPFLQPYHIYPLTSFYNEWLAFALGLAAALLLAKKECAAELALPAVALAPLGLLIVLALQAALGRVTYLEQASTAAFYSVWALLLMLLGAALRRELGLTALAETLAWCLVVGGAMNAAIGVLQHFQIHTPFDFLVSRKTAQAVFGDLAQPNHFADYMALALASAAYLYAREKLPGVLAVVLVSIFLPVLALTGSRSPWLYLSLFVVLTAVFSRYCRAAAGRRLVLFVMWLTPGFALAQWVVTLSFFQPPQQEMLVTSAQRLFEVASGIAVRWQLYREAWAIFLNAPLLGAGFGQFAWHHFEYQALFGGVAGAQAPFNNAHNIVLHLLAETGIAGTLPVLAAAGIWLTGLRRETLDLQHWWLLAVLGVVGIHSMLEFPLWYSYFLGPVALLLGAGSTRLITLRLARAGRWPMTALLAFACFQAVVVIPPYRDFERLVFATRNPDTIQVANALAQAEHEPMLRPYVETVLSYGIVVSEDHLQDKLAFNQRVMQFAAWPDMVYRQALLLALAGEQAAARHRFEQAARVNPEEIPRAVAALEELDRRYPGKFKPLLELATAKR